MIEARVVAAGGDRAGLASALRHYDALLEQRDREVQDAAWAAMEREQAKADA